MSSEWQGALAATGLWYLFMSPFILETFLSNGHPDLKAPWIRRVLIGIGCIPCITVLLG